MGLTMNDYDKAVKKIGNRFDFVLVATERLRELRREERRLEEAGLLEPGKRKESLHHRAISDIENGVVGREYLDNVKRRTNTKSRM